MKLPVTPGVLQTLSASSSAISVASEGSCRPRSGRHAAPPLRLADPVPGRNGGRLRQRPSPGSLKYTHHHQVLSARSLKVAFTAGLESEFDQKRLGRDYGPHSSGNPQIANAVNRGRKRPGDAEARSRGRPTIDGKPSPLISVDYCAVTCPPLLAEDTNENALGATLPERVFEV